MTKDEALKLALEALEFYYDMHEEEADAKAITAIKQAIANDALEKKAENARELGLNYEPEPWSNVGIGVDVTKEGVSVVGIYKLSNDSSHLFYSQFYTIPPQRTWVGLTEAQCGVLWKTNMTPFEYYQAIEAKLKKTHERL